MIYIMKPQYSWGDKFFVYEEEGSKKYSVKSSVLLWSRKLEVLDMDKNLLVTIKADPKSLLNPLKKKFLIQFADGREISVIRTISIPPKYTIEGLDWKMHGVMIHNYELLKDNEPVMSFSEERLYYELKTKNPSDELMALAIVLTISYAMHMSDEGGGTTHH